MKNMINNSLCWVSEQDDETLLNGSESTCSRHAAKIPLDTGMKAFKSHRSFLSNAMGFISGLRKETDVFHLVGFFLLLYVYVYVCVCVCIYLTTISFMLLEIHNIKRKSIGEGIKREH